jgi:predicted deacylase
LRVNFLDDSYHFVSSRRATLFSFSISLGHTVEQGTSLFIVLSRLLARV